MKKGFTLAEVLITLGIIGVVAALTAPALVQDTGSAKVGPTLAKAVTTFELANQNMLTATDSPSLKASPAGSGTGLISKSQTYIEELSNYMKISLFDDSKSSKKYQPTTYDGASLTSGSASGLHGLTVLAIITRKYALSKDGVLYIINANTPVQYADSTAPIHKQLFGHVLIDINGKTKPNVLGKDIFIFSLAQDGTLRPVGSNQWSPKEIDNEEYNWQNGTKDKCNEAEVTSGWSCAGSIYENGLKVIY